MRVSHGREFQSQTVLGKKPNLKASDRANMGVNKGWRRVTPESSNFENRTALMRCQSCGVRGTKRLA